MATEERTEQPTPRKRRQARERGQVATSTDLSRAIGLLAIYLAWRIAGPGMADVLLATTRRLLQAAPAGDLDADTVMTGYARVLPLLLAVAGPIMAAAVVGAVIAAGAQTRGLLAAAGLSPDWNRVNPAAGAKRLVSWRGVMAAIKGVIKVALVLAISAWVLRGHAADIVSMAALELGPMVSLALGIAGEIIIKCTITLIVLGAADYAFEWWEHEKSLRMTRQELRRDLREEDGDPQIRQRRRKLRRAMLAQGISAELPQADVVVTNPTHYAVALRYDPATMSSPRVVARGQRAIAREIIRLARAHGITIVENPPVARSLFAACALGDAVPRELYQTVAEIFAAVYRRRRRARARWGGRRSGWRRAPITPPAPRSDRAGTGAGPPPTSPRVRAPSR